MYIIYTKIRCVPKGYAPGIFSLISAYAGIEQTKTRNWIMRINATVIFLVATMLQVSAASYAQKLTYSKKGATLEEIFSQISTQTGYEVLYSPDLVDVSKKLDVNYKNAELKKVLDELLDKRMYKYKIDQKNILVSKSAFQSPQDNPAPKNPQQKVKDRETLLYTIHGSVVDSAFQPLPGAIIKIKGTKAVYVAKSDGMFIIKGLSEAVTLTVSMVGYVTQEVEVPVNISYFLQISLKTAVGALNQVSIVSNGYQQLPKERATGSFTHITREMLNRSTGSDILTRLEGITNGLMFNRTVAEGENVEQFKLESRGRATIMSESSPLIVLDNFPFEGNIRDINPNDVESVTILKDAAAASIWGARAGNGVIVITSRRGTYNRKTEVSFSANTAITPKPDLFYDRNYMPSALVMEVQKARFLRGDFGADEYGMTSFSPYGELLIKQRDQLISEADFLKEEQLMQNADIRRDALKYLYQNSVLQQYAFNVNGGSNVNQYFFSVGYDKSKAGMVGNDNQRLTLNIQNTFKPFKALEFNTRLGYTRSKASNNAFNMTDISSGTSGLQPYTRLVDEAGNPLAIEWNIRPFVLEGALKKGMLPWQFVPLDEMKISDRTSASTMLNLQGSMRYQVVQGLSVDATYQYMESKDQSRRYDLPESYYVRNLVNNFTQTDGTSPIPYGGILMSGSPSESIQHSGRVMLNAQKQIRESLLSLLGGAEIRQSIRQSFPGSVLYNYDEDLGVGTSRLDFMKRYQLYSSWGDARVPGPAEEIYYRTNRDLSYFGNASYTLKSKYILSGSARWDGSNLFGVKTNQKGTLLWSAGASWDISSENFFKPGWLDHLRIRSTYGSSGNVNKDVSTFTVIDYSASAYRDPNLERYASISSPGNPSLRWEKVTTWNTGVDWSVFNNRLSGSLEFFTKKSTDLIGDAFIPPSTGINSENFQISAYRYNYASMMTKGIDLQLITKNIQGRMNWQTTWFFNFARDKVTNYYNAPTSNGLDYVGYNVPLDIGRSVSGIYALPWHGLDPTNGKVIIYKDGERTTDYADYIANIKPVDMVYAGVTNPPYYGSILNSVDWKRFQFSILLSWKAGYIYRRSSAFPGMEYGTNLNYHVDLLNKWQKPGDELHTNVPAGGGIAGYNQNEASAYMLSEALISKGDHLAVQDLNFSYTLQPGKKENPAFKYIRLYTYIRNLGFLWKADRNSVDPTSPSARYPQPIQYNLGMQVTF